MILIVCAAEELPDDYFTPTIADLKARQEQLRARATALNNSPLLTRAQREEQAKTKRDRWPNVRLPHSPHSFPGRHVRTLTTRVDRGSLFRRLFVSG